MMAVEKRYPDFSESATTSGIGISDLTQYAIEDTLGTTVIGPETDTRQDSDDHDRECADERVYDLWQ